MPNLSITLAPLYQLLQAKVKWTWGKPQKAFMEAKSQLTSSGILVHFDPQQELTLSCDASPYGVGAVLSQDGRRLREAHRVCILILDLMQQRRTMHNPKRKVLQLYCELNVFTNTFTADDS